MRTILFLTVLVLAPAASASGELLLQYVYSSSMVPKYPGYYALDFGVGASTARFVTHRTPTTVGQAVFADSQTLDWFNTVFGGGFSEVDIVHFGEGANTAGIPDEQGTQPGPSPAFKLIERFVPGLGQGLTGYRLTGIEHILDSYSEEPNIGQHGTVRVSAQQTIKFHGDVIPDVPGDFTRNGEVDAADYVLWRKRADTTGSLPNESGQTPSLIGAEDNLYWRTNFGDSAYAPSLSAAGIPEPATVLLALVASLMAAGRRWR
jgi:hypothetical protein